MQCRSEGPKERRQKCVIYSEGTLDPYLFRYGRLNLVKFMRFWLDRFLKILFTIKLRDTPRYVIKNEGFNTVDHPVIQL